MKTLSTRIEFTVLPEEGNQRLDRFLANRLSETSRSRIQTLIEDGRVLVDGIAIKPSHRVQPGEIVAAEVPPPAAPGVGAEAIPLEVLYEDEDVAVINKPAGMIVHPGAGAERGTMVAALLHRFGGIGGLSAVGGPLRPGIVHRLDKETSGTIVIARTDAAHKELVSEFRDRVVEKTYLALLHGKIKGEKGTISLPVARDLRRRSRMTTRRGDGRDARTDWRVRLRLDGFTLVEAHLHTGRTHQIRVHFSALGCPIAGDTLYGAPRQERTGSELLPPLLRNFLHAVRLAFLHPRTHDRIEFKAPLPPELLSYLRTLGRATNTDAGTIDAALREFL